MPKAGLRGGRCSEVEIQVKDKTFDSVQSMTILMIVIYHYNARGKAHSDIYSLFAKFRIQPVQCCSPILLGMSYLLNQVPLTPGCFFLMLEHGLGTTGKEG